MATSLFIKLCGPVLFVIILQANRISALECYRCFAHHSLPAIDNQAQCLADNVPEKFLVTEANWSETRPNWSNFTNINLTGIKNYTQEPSCIKWWNAKKGAEAMYRDILQRRPQASDLDVSGCIGNEHGRFCFCNQDRCNDGPILQVTLNSALQCYGCAVGPTLPPLIARKECLLDNPPAEFLVNQITARSFKPFQKGTDDVLKKMILEGVPMRPGPFCVKISPKQNDEVTVIRYVMPEGPEAKYLDEFNCLENDEGRACFCNQDKCNNGPVTPRATDLQPTNGTSSSSNNGTSPSSTNETSVSPQNSKPNAAITFKSPTVFLLIIPFVVVAAKWW